MALLPIFWYFLILFFKKNRGFFFFWNTYYSGTPSGDYKFKLGNNQDYLISRQFFCANYYHFVTSKCIMKVIYIAFVIIIVIFCLFFLGLDRN